MRRLFDSNISERAIEMTPDEKAAFTKEIESAFANTEYPGDDGIGHSELDFLKGLHWKALTDFHMSFLKDELWLMYPAGLYFYLPALLIALVNRPDNTDTIRDTLVKCLSPHGGVTTNQFPPMLTRMMTREQRQVVYRFLVAYPDLYPDGFWGRDDYNFSVFDNTLAYWLKASTT